MKKIKINKKKFLKFLQETKRVTGYTPSTAIIRQKFNLLENTLIRFLHLLEKEGAIVINKGKKGNNFYNLTMPQYKCNSFFDENNELKDCFCGKCK